MLISFNKNTFIPAAVTAAIGTLVLAAAAVINPVNHYLSSLVLVVSAVALYFSMVAFVAEGNWLDFRAIFTAAWLGTIGLAVLRLAKYQEPWQGETWLLLILTYAMFQIGVNLGIAFGGRLQEQLAGKLKKLHIGRVQFQMQENRLFLICVITTLIGLGCFLANVAIKGFVPAFSNIFNAYTVFYTRFHVFAVASTAVSGLCYYCIVTQKLALWKKIILGICIVYSVIVFPVLVVSRGVLIVAALSLSTTVFYLHRKKLWIFVLCVALIMGVYLFASELRNYTADQMNVFFEPAEIPLPGQTETTEPSGEESSEPSSEDTTEKPEAKPAGSTFTLSPKMAFLYSYITVSHDNLNEAVKHLENYTYGIRQLEPFNVILRNGWINQKLAEAEYHQVNPYLNTTNLIGDFYYDFGIPGVAVCMLLWAAIFGLMQGWYDRSKGIFSLLLLGNTMVPVMLCFFSTWLSLFSHWLIWGTALMLALAACITPAPKSKA